MERPKRILAQPKQKRNTARRVSDDLRIRAGGPPRRGSAPLLVAAVLGILALGSLPALALGQTGPLGHVQAATGHDPTTTVITSFRGNLTITNQTVVHNVTHLIVTTLRTLTGNMTGTLLAYEWGAIQPNGSMWVSGTGTFVGSIRGGHPGILHLWWTHAVGVFGKSVTGLVFVGNGAKGLVGVHGSGPAVVAFTGGTGFSGSYSFHLDLR